MERSLGPSSEIIAVTLVKAVQEVPAMGTELHVSENRSTQSVTYVALAFLTLAAAFALSCTPTPEKQYDAPPPMTIDPNKGYTATLHLEKGDSKVVIELFAKEAPNTVNSFVFLARDGYYDNVTFHRVIPGFMAQTGDPTGTGKGGPGYRFDNEFAANRRHDAAGVVSMANSGVKNDRGTNGSQFFITYAAVSELDGLNADGSPKDCAAGGVSCHTVFGKVISGMSYVEQLTPRDPSKADFEGDRIKTTTIEETQ